MGSKSEVYGAEAPSNIALIKYMGKRQGQGNRPTNSSLSYTLNHLLTRVEIERVNEDARGAGGAGVQNGDRWEPLQWGTCAALQLSPQGVERFLKHFQLLKNQWGLSGDFVLRSANNFPADCGVASSASSYAALTLAAFELAKAESENPQKVESLTLEELADLSRQGSGSSGRSFFSPWAIWQEDSIRAQPLPQEHLYHQLILMETEKKAVSSSEAHQRVVSSALFEGRAERADKRLHQLLSALNLGEWERAYSLVWSEFWDMHALFETSDPSFGYITERSMAMLRRLRLLWEREKDGPLVTMDAGANVHLLWRPDQRQRAQKIGEDLGLQPGELISAPGLE